MKRFTKFGLFFVGLMLMGVMGVKADDVALKFTSMASGNMTSFTFSTGDKVHAGTDPTTFSRSSSNTCYTAPSNYRIQVKDIIIELVSTSASSITVEGMSTGSSSNRGIKSIEVSDTKTGTYTAVSAVKSGLINGQASCSSTTVSGFSIPEGKFVKLTFNTEGDDAGAVQNVNISGFIISPVASNSVISLMSGSADQSVMQSQAISNIVYVYGGTADNATFEWVGNAPAGNINGTVNTSDKKLTISGSVDMTAAVGEYSYKVTPKAGETQGTALTGKITVTQYATPAPTINLTSAASTTNQTVKDGNSIINITYNIANAKSVSVEGLPADVNFNFSDPVLTISGKANTGVYQAYNYTVKAVALDDYATPGQIFTATGSINVKDPNAKSVAFLYDATVAATALTNENGLYKMVIEANYDPETFNANNANYSQADMDKITSGNYALIVIHESVKSANTLAIALGAKRGVLPILNTKPHMYGKENWPAGAGNNGAAANTSLCVNAGYANHPMFNGVTMTGENNSVSMGSGIIRWVDVTTATTGQYIANNSVETTTTAVSVIEENNQTSVDNNKYLLISISAASENLNSNGALLFKNACEYLMKSSVYAPQGTGAKSVIEGKEVASVKYYTITGIEVNPSVVSGIVITKTTYTDGSVKTAKIIK